MITITIDTVEDLFKLNCVCRITYSVIAYQRNCNTSNPMHTYTSVVMWIPKSPQAFVPNQALLNLNQLGNTSNDYPQPLVICWESFSFYAPECAVLKVMCLLVLLAL